MPGGGICSHQVVSQMSPLRDGIGGGVEDMIVE